MNNGNEIEYACIYYTKPIQTKLNHSTSFQVQTATVSVWNEVLEQQVEVSLIDTLQHIHRPILNCLLRNYVRAQ